MCSKWIQSNKLSTRPNSTCACANPVPGDLPQRKPTTNTHPTCKPAALCAYLATLCTREGETVLDPFCGSGSTGVACARIGRRFVGVELDEGYAEIARARIAYAEAKRIAERLPSAPATPSLFEEAAK